MTSLEDYVPEDREPEQFAAMLGSAAGATHLGLVNVANVDVVSQALGSGSNTLVFGAIGAAGAVTLADIAGVIDFRDDA